MMTIARAIAASTLALGLLSPGVVAEPGVVSPTSIIPAVLAVDPPSAQDATRLQNEGRFEEAAQAWLAVTNEEPDNGTAWFNLGYCLHASGRLDDAIEVHRKAAEYERFHGIALYNLGCAYALQGRTDDAFAALFASKAAGFGIRGSAEGDSDLNSLHNDARWGELLSGGGARGGGGGGGGFREKIQGIAMHVADALGANDPDFEQNIQVIAERVMGHVERAVQGLLESMAQDDVLAPVLVKLGVFPPEILEHHAAAQERDDPGHARAEAPRADARPADAVSADAAGALAAAQQAQQAGDFAAGARGYAMVLRSNPDSVPARFGHAYCLHMDGQYEKAIEAHRAAAEYAPIRGIALYNLGCAYALTGKLDQALEALAASREAGFDVAGNAPGDDDLRSIRSDPRFDAIVGR